MVKVPRLLQSTRLTAMIDNNRAIGVPDKAEKVERHCPLSLPFYTCPDMENGLLKTTGFA